MRITFIFSLKYFNNLDFWAIQHLKSLKMLFPIVCSGFASATIIIRWNTAANFYAN